MEINQDIRNAARKASSAYRSEQKKQGMEKAKEKEDANKEVNEEISTLKITRKRIVTLKESVDQQMERAEKERNIVHVTKANGFKRMIKEMDVEDEQLNEKIENLKKKLKH